MANHNARNFLQTALRTLLVAPLLYRTAGKVASLVKDEVQQFKQHLGTILIALMMLTALLTTAWMCLQALMFYGLIYLQLGIPLALSLVLLLNIILLIGTGLWMASIKRNLFFPESRRLMLALKK